MLVTKYPALALLFNQHKQQEHGGSENFWCSVGTADSEGTEMEFCFSLLADF
jgi:hypothetical protein